MSETEGVEDGLDEMPTDDVLPEVCEWNVEVVNALTGKIVLAEAIDKPEYILHTVGWDAGVYVVRAVMGEKPLYTGKITVTK